MTGTCADCAQPCDPRATRCWRCARTPNAVLEDGRVVCRECGEAKPPEEMKRRAGHPGSVVAWCRDCAAEWHRRWKLARKYGLTVEQYDDLLAAQGGVCAICRRDPVESGTRWGRLHVDHDHATGAVRALLCNRCNTGIGAFEDDLTLLLAAVEYLRAHDVTTVPSGQTT